MEVALLEDEMVPFAGFVQRLFDAQGYLGASTLVKYTLWTGMGHAFVRKVQVRTGSVGLVNIYIVETDGLVCSHGVQISTSEDIPRCVHACGFCARRSRRSSETPGKSRR
jgi:hypothetical protein